MSDKNSLYLRYEIRPGFFDREVTEKGIIANLYYGDFPLQFASRAIRALAKIKATVSRKYFTGIGEISPENGYYQTFRRHFDVDFDTERMNVSVDLACKTKRSLQGRFEPYYDLNSNFFFNDEIHGQLLMDMKMDENMQPQVKYAFVMSPGIPDDILSAEEYLKDAAAQDKEQSEYARALVTAFGEEASLMTKAEVKAYFNDPVLEYLYDYEGRRYHEHVLKKTPKRAKI